MAEDVLLLALVPEDGEGRVSHALCHELGQLTLQVVLEAVLHSLIGLPCPLLLSRRRGAQVDASLVRSLRKPGEHCALLLLDLGLGGGRGGRTRGRSATRCLRGRSHRLHCPGHRGVRARAGHRRIHPASLPLRATSRSPPASLLVCSVFRFSF